MGELSQFILFGSVIFMIAVFSQWAFIFEIAKQLNNKKGFLETAHILLAVIASILIFSFSDKPSSDETIRNVILTLGGVGGFYALIIARKRQDRFEDQVQMQQDQRFSDKLSNCLENMSMESSINETAGILLLEEVYNTAPEKQKNTVGEIIKQYIQDKSKQNDETRNTDLITRLFSFYLESVTNKSEVKFSNLVLSQFTLNQTKVTEVWTFSNVVFF